MFALGNQVGYKRGGKDTSGLFLACNFHPHPHNNQYHMAWAGLGIAPSKSTQDSFPLFNLLSKEVSVPWLKSLGLGKRWGLGRGSDLPKSLWLVRGRNSECPLCEVTLNCATQSLLGLEGKYPFL